MVDYLIQARDFREMDKRLHLLIGLGRVLKNGPEYLPSDNRPEFE